MKDIQKKAHCFPLKKPINATTNYLILYGKLTLQTIKRLYFIHSRFKLFIDIIRMLPAGLVWKIVHFEILAL